MLEKKNKKHESKDKNARTIEEKEQKSKVKINNYTTTTTD